MNFAGSNEARESVTVYAAGARGDAAPIQTIAGENTHIVIPTGIAVDSGENIYVANNLGPSSKSTVTVFAAGATGDVAPIQEIFGAKAGLVNPTGIAVDAARNIYVASIDGYNGIVWVFAAGSSGDVAPIRTITGSDTGLNSPGGIAVDGQGLIYVVNENRSFQGPSSVTIYAPAANGNVAPIRTIAGSATGLTGSVGLALDDAANIYVSSYSAQKISVFAAGANGNLAPLRTIGGPKTDLSLPRAIAVQ